MELVADHLPPPPEEWGEHDEHREPTDNATKIMAWAPARIHANGVWAGLFKRNSLPYIWGINFRSPRHRNPLDPGVPIMFPEVTQFWRLSKSVATFKWGFEKHCEIYPHFSWHGLKFPTRQVAEFHGRPVTDGDAASMLRDAIHVTMERTPPWIKVSRHRRAMVQYTVHQGLWDGAPLVALSKQVRALVLWRRAQWILKVRSWALCWLEFHAMKKEEKRIAVVAGGEYDDPELCAAPACLEAVAMVMDAATGRGSPSLKRARRA